MKAVITIANIKATNTIIAQILYRKLENKNIAIKQIKIQAKNVETKPFNSNIPSLLFLFY